MIYAPQALGLIIGEKLNCSIDASYLLARFSALLATILILLASFWMYDPPAGVMALLVLPMTIFQMASSSLDGVSTALAVLALSIFLRTAIDKENTPSLLLLPLSISVFLVATSRPHLLPMVLLIFGVYCFTGKKNSIYAGLLVTIGYLIWMLMAIKITVPYRPTDVAKTLSSSGIFFYYVSHPIVFLKVLVATCVDREILDSYYKSFLGILGCLDAPFSRRIYTNLCFLLFLSLGLSASLRDLRRNWQVRTLLLAAAAGSVFMIFLALLVTWSPHPAKVIEGVQGRYFLVPAIMVFYALSYKESSYNQTTYKYWGSRLIVCVLLFYSVYNTAGLLLQRYYLSVDAVETSSLGTKVGGHHFGELIKGRVFEQTFRAGGEILLDARLFCATFGRTNSGHVVLELRDKKGVSLFKKNIEAVTIHDNAWMKVPVGGLRVFKGEAYTLRLISDSGTPGNAVTWWASNGNTYLDGVAIVDTAATESDFAFELRFLK